MSKRYKHAADIIQDGVNAAVNEAIKSGEIQTEGIKYGPIPEDPQRTIDSLRTRLQQVEIERDEAKVARDFAELACQRKDERLKEAEWIIKNSFNATHSGMASKEWLKRRDTFLNPKPQDVM